MVKSKVFLLFIFFLIVIPSVNAQNLEYHLENEWVKIWINQDGTIDLLYIINIVCDQGTLHWVEVGQPNSNFTIGQAFDENNNQLATTETSQSGDYKVRVDLIDLEAGSRIQFNLTTNVAKMIWEDKDNTGNVGMLFTPTWFPVTIDDLRVAIVLPSGISPSELKTLEGMEWNSSYYENSNIVVYWERHILDPNQKFNFGVSFPKEFVQHWEVQPSFLESYGLLIVGATIFLVIISILIFVLGKKPYLKPIISVEALGIKRGLTAVEASYLLDMKPNMVVTEILYSLLKKQVVWVKDVKPSIKLQILKKYSKVDSLQPSNTNPRYYEIDFINAIKRDGRLDEEKLAMTITFLARAVEEKLRGYCRSDTIDYYRRIVEQAWSQVEQAGTPKIASQMYNEHLLWLFLDPNYRSKTERTFKEISFDPKPVWFWYWYTYRHYHPRPKYEPNLDSPATTTQSPPKIPGSEFADNIATALEGTSRNIVSNIEKFTNSIIPAAQPQKSSRQPAHQRSSCVCACAACACACACVSCACACAGGGAG